MWRMPASVINQTINAPEFFYRRSDEIFNVFNFGNITFDKMCLAFAQRIHFGFKFSPLCFIASAKNYCGSGFDEDANAAFANAFCAAGDDGDFIFVAHNCDKMKAKRRKSDRAKRRFVNQLFNLTANRPITPSLFPPVTSNNSSSLPDCESEKHKYPPCFPTLSPYCWLHALIWYQYESTMDLGYLLPLLFPVMSRCT